jgi:hypothetical protein
VDLEIDTWIAMLLLTAYQPGGDGVRYMMQIDQGVFGHSLKVLELLHEELP